jgi:hypothetical protein
MRRHVAPLLANVLLTAVDTVAENQKPVAPDAETAAMGIGPVQAPQA